MRSEPLDKKSFHVNVARFAAQACDMDVILACPTFCLEKITYLSRTFGEVKLGLLLRWIQNSEAHRIHPPEVGKISESFFATRTGLPRPK